MAIKTQLIMTASERAIGRFMRAPDHDAGGGENDAGGDSSDADAGGEDSGDNSELSTEEQLEKEFGDPDEADDEDDSDDNDDDQSSDADEDEDEDESEDEESEEEEEKPVSRNQKRIDDLTEKARLAEADAAAWKRKAEELGATAEGSSEMELPVEPNVDDFEYGEHDVDYIKAQAKYEASMEILEKQVDARFKSDAAALDAKWAKTLAAASKEFPDFEEVVEKTAKEGKWRCPPVIVVGIKDSDYGAHIAHHLATNTDDSERIAKLTPLEQAREFGRLEERFHTAKTAPKPKVEIPQPKKTTAAPKPPKKRVSGNGNARAEAAADSDDFLAFERMADAKLGMKK